MKISLLLLSVTVGARALPAPAADSIATGIVVGDVEIFVNPAGKPFSTSTSTTTIVNQPTDAPAVANAVRPSVQASEAPAPALSVHSSHSAAAAAAPTVAAAPSSSGTSFTRGIAYSPYTASGACKSTSQVASDLGHLSSYDVIRLYGTDCNQIANALGALGTNQRIIAGIFDLKTLSPEIQSLTTQVHHNWAKVHSVSVGNELVNSGQASVSAVTGAIATVRSAVRAAGFQGPVVTVDTMNAVAANPALCTASDYCAINCHAFFDPTAAAGTAGAFVQGWVATIQKIAGPAKKVIVTESGWPSQGQANGVAVPSQANLQAAVGSLKTAFKQNLVYYSAFNTLWQQNNPSTFGTNQFWGIYGNAPSGP